MSFDLTRFEDGLRLVEWQNEQLEAITAQLEAAFPELQKSLSQRVAKMWTVTVGVNRINPKPVLEEVLTPWAEAQTSIALERAESSLSELIANLSYNAGYGGMVTAALPALAGVGMLAASAMALPGLISFATVTTTSFLLFSTSGISMPILLVGGTVLAGASLAGLTSIGYAQSNLRKGLESQLQQLALRAVFGHGADPQARCLLTDLQAMVLKAGETELKAMG